ncbi:TetR/AcrR family transcriptional regulator [Glycomyces paridis]|uniref:TetR/AcrR family transcriptional regulator n=1 Tax=Glycomyces paridis TaxID=2126555 RepID=UPI00130547C7|nr:TetR/AcrR family transcriptional regulator [Glycomyces paridis]
MASGRERNRRGQGGLLREEILDAAHAVLVESGGEGAVTIRGVARKAGIAPQSCYLHFATRDDLLWALYAREFDRLHARLLAAGADAPPLERLRARARAYCAFAMDEPGAYALLFQTRGVAEHDWDGRLPGRATIELWVATVAAVVDDGRDALVAATELWAALHGSVTLRRDLPAFTWPLGQDETIDRVIRALVAPRFPRSDAAGPEPVEDRG